MSNTASQDTLNAKNAELFKLLMPHRQSDVMQRVNLYAVDHTKKRLPEYVNDPDVGLDEKLKFIEELTVIVNEQAWDKLPAAPACQAGDNGKGSGNYKAAAPAPAKKPAAPTSAPAPKPAIPMPEPTVTAGVPAESQTEAAEPEDADPLTLMQAALTKLAAQPKGKQFTEADVRRIVRQELAAVLSTTAEVLRK